MALHIGRRKFVAALGGATFAWPLAGRAQQPSMPVIGYLSGAGLDLEEANNLVPFRQGLKEAGFVEGRNVAIEIRTADNHVDRLPALAASLVDHRVAVMVAIGGAAPALAAKAATTTIPIVFSNGGDPVRLGLVSSLNHPGGNLTGVSFLANTLGAKRIELLHELVRTAKVIGFLINPSNPNSQSELRDVQMGARALGLQLIVLNATKEQEIDAAFANFSRQRVDALFNAADIFFAGRREQIVALAAQYAVPAIYHLRFFATAGGLMSYGTSVDDAQRLAGTYVGRILKGEKPGDLPVQQSVKVELVINLATAKALGITFPLSLLGRADEVIE